MSDHKNPSQKITPKKIAFVHDWLLFRGGAEQVFFDLVQQEQKTFPDHVGKVFTLISDKDIIEIGDRKYRVIQSLPRWVAKPFIRASTNKDSDRRANFMSKWLDYRHLIVIYPLCMLFLSRKIKRFAPERIVISSFAIAKNIDTDVKDTKLYLHSPMGYIWANYEEYRQKFTGRKKTLFTGVAPILRIWDKTYWRFGEVVFNSHFTADRAKKLYGMTGRVEYPPIHPVFHSAQVIPLDKRDEYYVFCGRLVLFLRELDVVMALCKKLNIRLLVIGDGPDALKIKQMAAPTVTFVGYVSDVNAKRDLIRRSKGLINLAFESAGMTTLEAMLCGVPVFGYRRGGTAELVDEDCGVLVETKNLDELADAFEEFAAKKFDPDLIRQRALAKIAGENLVSLSPAPKKTHEKAGKRSSRKPRSA